MSKTDDYLLQYIGGSVYIVAGPVLPVEKKGGQLMNELVRLRTRPSRDGMSFVYLLDYVNIEGKRRRVSLGHADKRKAEREKKQKECELRMGIISPASMRLMEFVADSLIRTGKQIREATHRE
jgi:hypothetical protein